MGVKVREKIKGSGVWWVFVHHQGERDSKQVGDYKAALKLKQLTEADIALGKWSPAKEEASAAAAPTVDEYFATFSRTYLATAVRDSTQISYAGSFKNHISPMLGGIRMDRLSRTKVKEFVGGLVAKGLAKASIRIITAELAAVFNSAIEDGIVSENPAKRLTKFYKQAPVVHEEIQPLTRDEVPLFLGSVTRRSPEHYPLFLCAIHTGLRSGELAGLKWADVDFNGKFLNVRNNVVRGRVRNTKTDKRRRVDVSDTLFAELFELRRRRKEAYLGKGKNEIPEWVFCNRTGKAPDMHNVKNRTFFACLEKAGLRRIRFHDLRHTFASLLIQDGQSLKYVSEQLGHSSIKLTADVYGHLVPGANRQAVNRLPGLSSESPSQTEASGQ